MDRPMWKRCAGTFKIKNNGNKRFEIASGYDKTLFFCIFQMVFCLIYLFICKKRVCDMGNDVRMCQVFYENLTCSVGPFVGGKFCMDRCSKREGEKMKISELYEKKKRSLSFEIFPPKKDSELKNIDATLEVLCELKPDFISVTFGAGGSSNCNRTIELARKIKYEYQVEPVVHLTCLSYDREEIDSFIEVLNREGIQNVLALRGDKNPNLPEKDDFRHASDLISYLKQKGDFCLAGACYPECHPESENRVSEMKYLKKKVDAGAQVLLSQLFFDNEKFFHFADDCRIAGIDVPVIPGIMPVINAAQIRRMVTMCGASFPERFQKIIHKYENNKEALFDAGMSYALSQIIDLLVNDIDGIHLYTMNHPGVARKICEGIRNII